MLYSSHKDTQEAQCLREQEVCVCIPHTHLFWAWKEDALELEYQDNIQNCLLQRQRPCPLGATANHLPHRWRQGQTGIWKIGTDLSFPAVVYYGIACLIIWLAEDARCRTLLSQHWGNYPQAYTKPMVRPIVLWEKQQSNKLHLLLSASSLYHLCLQLHLWNLANPLSKSWGPP